MNRDDAYRDWKDRANQVPLLAAAKRYKAVLKKAGREWVGPCPNCNGTDRFSINESKGKWNCRGAEGGSTVVGMVMHIAGLSFAEACEELTGEPSPNGPAKPLSAAEQEARAKRREESDRIQQAAKAQQERYGEDTREAAAAIWAASQPISGTLGQTYFKARGIACDLPGVLRFHTGLPYPGTTGRIPAIVCRVDDVCGDLTAVWRIYLGADGSKADLPNAKLGLGPAGGGAVRIGGPGPKISACEGVETALGYWLLTGKKRPSWATLSTSGMIGFEVPLGVEHVIVVPDGDLSMRRRGDEYEPAIPAGRKAAHALRDRLKSEGIGCAVAPEPSPTKDYLDIYNASLRDLSGCFA